MKPVVNRWGFEPDKRSVLLREALAKKLAILSRPRPFLIAVVLVLFAHLMLHINETYDISYSVQFTEYTLQEGPETHYSTVNYSSLGRDRYKDLIESIPQAHRADAIDGTTISYFNLLPSWIINIVYVVYLCLLLLMVANRHKY